MMIVYDESITEEQLRNPIDQLWELAQRKVADIHATIGQTRQTPVFTVRGRYQAQGWTEWTQGFQFGCPILLFDATGDLNMLQIGREATLRRMSTHLTHVGVHDHGFNNISTYGNLRRLARHSRFDATMDEIRLYELALKVSGAVQAARWTSTVDGGFIYSFNGPHSLFSDTIRSLRSLAMAHVLGQSLLGENDRRISLLERLIQHANATADFNVYFGDGRDAFDVPGRVAHESIFNVNDGNYRCPSTQQGYSPFSTWTRGLAWIMLGFAELLEFWTKFRNEHEELPEGFDELEAKMERAARVTCEFYCEQTPTCGVPVWDTGAPGLGRLDGYLERPADPFNGVEPVDSSAAAIACQGLLRFGRRLMAQGDTDGEKFWKSGLTVLQTLLHDPYISTSAEHQGLLLHTVYHRPRNWDYIPEGSAVPHGESCMWGDYHLIEAALYVHRLLRGEMYYTFFE